MIERSTILSHLSLAMLANAQLQMFGLNIWLIIGALLLLVVGLIVLISVWTGVKIIWWRADQRRADRQMRQKRFAADGTPLPPSSRGICTVCNRAMSQVYHFESGDRLCADHYREHTQKTRTSPRPARIS